jgi:hypothetical protein
MFAIVRDMERQMPQIPSDQVAPYGPNPTVARRFISTSMVAQRYGVHLRSIARWVARGVIPPPDLTINHRHYWDQAALDRHERERIAERAK